MGSRVDVWEVKPKVQDQSIECGYAKNYHEKYTRGPVLGRGGFGVVAVVRDRETGKEYACKSINKRLEGNVSDKKQARHIGNIRREVSVLRRLRGTLNVAHLKQVYEDDNDVHVVMEYCRGGELWHRIGNKHYAERTVASFMRAVLRTLSQCHSHRILHRDIKPGNFMLLNDADRAPLKAIDFGLAVFYDPGDLPRTDLGLEGTPWFMAPEVMSSEVYPSSDIWSAGVMAYQLLSGTLPFDDRRRPHAPALSVVWQAILTQEPSFSGKAWQDVSQAAQAFVKRLLNKTHTARPTAKEALQDPWLQGNSLERTQGKPLDATVVQRLQRYSQTNVLKRTIFELIAEEIIKRMTQQHIEASPDPSYHNSGHCFPKESMSPAASLPASTPPEDASSHNAGSPPMNGRKRSLTQELADSGSAGVAIPRKAGMSAHGGLEYHRAMLGGTAMDSTSVGAMSVHDANNWQMIKTALETAKHRRSGSLHGGQHFAKKDDSKEQYRKAARIALDTSAHAGSEYYNFVRLSSSQAGQNSSSAPGVGSYTEPHAARKHDSWSTFRRTPQESVQRPSEALAPVATGQPAIRRSRSGGLSEFGKRGQSEYAQFLRRASLEQCSPTATEGASPDASPTRQDSIDALARASLDWPPASAHTSARNSFEWQSSGLYSLPAGNRQVPSQSQQGSANGQTHPAVQLSAGRQPGSSLPHQGSGIAQQAPEVQQQSVQQPAATSSRQHQGRASAAHPQAAHHQSAEALQPGSSSQFPAAQQQHQQADMQAGTHADRQAPPGPQAVSSTPSPFSLQQPTAGDQRRELGQQSLQRPSEPQHNLTESDQGQFGQQRHLGLAQPPDALDQAEQQPQADQQVKHTGGEAEQRRLTFQEILRQQLDAHSHQVSLDDGSTAEPGHHSRTPSPLPTPPMSVHRPHLSFEDMLRQQLGQQVGGQQPAGLSNGSQHTSGRTSPFRRPLSAGISSKPSAFQDMLRRQLNQGSQQAEEQGSESAAAAAGSGMEALTAGRSMAAAEDAYQQVAPDSRQHDDDEPHAVAEITPTGLRLTDAEGTSSLVPLDELRSVMRKLAFSKKENGISVEQLAEGLRGLGYELCSSELGVLMHQLAVTQQGQVGKPAFLASQLDWQNFQQNFKDQWLECARAAFASVDASEKGHISSGQLINLISSKLPAEEVEHAVEQALMEAGCGDLEDLDFDAFLKLMRVNSLDSLDSLDQYDSRLNSTANLQGLESGSSAHNVWDGHVSQLEVVPE